MLCVHLHLSSYLLRLERQARAANFQSCDALLSPAGTVSTEIEWTFAGSDNWILCQSGQYRQLASVPTSGAEWS